MNWQSLLDPQLKEFIRDHEKDDVASLALKTPPDREWPWKLVLDQIKSRQKARIKLPRWPDHHPDILFPPADVMEQASSAATARYKARLVKGKTFCDLTGGTGVDSCAMSEYFQSGFCIDVDETAAALIAHNLPLLILSSAKIDVHHARAEDFIKDMPPVDVVIMDPQRRTENRKGIYKLEECTPDMISLLPQLKTKAKMLILKASPMMDITKGIEQLQHVAAVHVLEWQGECKEVVYVLDFANSPRTNDVPVTAVSLNDGGEVLKSLSYNRVEEKNCVAALSAPLNYLYEPGPAFQKAGAFNVIAKQFGVLKLHPHTHLYTSENPCPDFPGRVFEIQAILPVDKKSLPVKKANLVIRNFPARIDELKKRLELKDGGEDFLFACTLENDRKALIHARKYQGFN